MARDQIDMTPIESRDELVAWFEKGCKPASQFRVGTEHEKFAFTLDGHRPVPYEGPKGIRALLDGTQSAYGKFQSTGSRTVMRRLSSREYENTLATLFGRRVDTLGLTADFPKEKTSQHMDTIGKSLVTSGFLVDQYFQSANRLVETRLGKPATEAKSWRFNSHFLQYEELSGSHKSAFNYRYLCLYEQPNTDTRQGGYGHIEDFKQGVPVSGLYDIEVEAAALHRDTHYDPAIFGIDFSEPFILGVVPLMIATGPGAEMRQSLGTGRAPRTRRGVPRRVTTGMPA